jgi:hypothetical protein
MNSAISVIIDLVYLNTAYDTLDYFDCPPWSFPLRTLKDIAEVSKTRTPVI